MKKETCTIGLDFGTLSGRGILVRCRDGKILAESTKEYRHGVLTSVLPDGCTPLERSWALQHPGDYLEVLEQIVRELVSGSGIHPGCVAGLGIDFTSCTMLPVDPDGTPLCMKKEWQSHRNAYVKLWNHHSAISETERVNTVLAETGLGSDARFGGKCSSELLIPKVMETWNEDPALYETADEFLEAGDWLTRVLTGSRARSCSMAGYKAWWSQEKGYPTGEFLEKLDPRLKNFFAEKAPGEVRAMGTCIGRLCPDQAEKLGLRAGTAVAPAIIDSHAGVPGSGVCSADEMLLVLGTSGVLIGFGKTPYSGKGVMGGVRDAIIPGVYGYESGLASVGNLFSWFAENMLPASYVKEAEETHTDVFDLLNQKAAAFGPGESGLLALDWWNGNKTPYVDAQLTGAVLGLTRDTKPEEIYRALIEATAFAVRRIIDIMEENGARPERIIASGGIPEKNPFLMQIYADILGKKLETAGSTQAAALGSAIYASLAAGKANGGYDAYEQAVKHMCPDPGNEYIPDSGNHQTYNRLYRLYITFSDQMGRETESVMKQLALLK